MDNLNLTKNEQYEIFPTPQERMYHGGETGITQDINIIMQASFKQATLPKLQEVLTLNGFTYTMSDKFVEEKTNLYLADKKHVEESYIDKIYTGTMPEISQKEGYVLVINGNDIGHMAIIGNDADGIHYGVVTLEKVLSQTVNHRVKNCVIADYPNILYRGFIEGFYGFPWSHEDRMDLMAFGAKQKLNSYIYAPKDDPYHRKNWRDLYPAEKAKEIAELAEAGHINNLNFVWTIHPGDSIDLSLEEDFQSALKKLEQLYTLGVRQFGILFDDIVGIPDGLQQAEFINRIDTEFIKKKGDIRPLITVGTRYCEAWGPSMIDYFKPFVETLHEDIEIMWTGAATMSNISKEQFDAPKRQIDCDKNLSVWWNYPVNDYCDQKLLMGKIENLSADVDNVNGFFSNPMNQAQASKQALFCIADHNWNTKAFDCEASFSASFKALAPEVAEDLEIFATNSCYLMDDGGASGTFLFDESWYLKEDIAILKEGVEQEADITEAADKLNSHFMRIEVAVKNIREKCLNVNLVKELEPFLEATKWMGLSGQNIIHAIKALKIGDMLTVENKIERARTHLNAMKECKVLRLKEESEQYLAVDVGTLVIKPFIEEMMTLVAIVGGIEQRPLELNYTRKNIALSALGISVAASDSVSEAQGPEMVITGGIGDGKWCATAYRPYLTIDLKEPKTIKQYRIINCGHEEARESRMWNTKQAQILASMDGEKFTLVDEVIGNTEDSIDRILFNEVTARYIRLQIVEPAQISINGGGHTRINAFELYEESYPEQSQKVLSTEMDIKENKIIINNIKKGDVIALYRSLDEKVAFAKSEEATEDADYIVFEGVVLPEATDRIFAQRTSRNYLPSVRTSKGIINS